MEREPIVLNPELLSIVAGHGRVPPERLAPSTHLVFDLGIDGDDIDDLVRKIEAHFQFVGTNAEWRSAQSLGDIDALVGRLRGTVRPEVNAELERDAATAGRRNRRTIALICGWLSVGFVAYLNNRQLFEWWIVATLCWELVRVVRSGVRGSRARRQWKRERLARYGV